MADISHADFQHEPDYRRHPFGQPAETDMESAESHRRQQQGWDPYSAVKRLVKQQDCRNSGGQAEQKVLKKDQHRRGTAFFDLWKNAEDRQFSLPQFCRRNAPGEQSCQAQAIIDCAEEHAGQKGPQVQPRNCAL